MYHARHLLLYWVFKMSEDKNFKEQASKRHLFLAVVVTLAMPLLPMLMGWYTFLS